MRSVSFTLSSLASVITVVPEARAAATTRIGISSMSVGISSPAMVVPESSVPLTTRSPTGSPAFSLIPSTAMCAPMRSRTARNPVRVGFRQTSRTTISEPAVAAAHITGNAAEEGSPGTTTSLAWSLCPPGMPTDLAFTLRFAPKNLSMRSVWSLL